MSVRLLAAAAIAVLVTAGCRSINARPVLTAANAQGAVCDLTQLRVARVVGEDGPGGLGGDNQGLLVRFVNDGHTCTVGRSFPLAVTATTDTRVVIRAKLHRRLRLSPGQAVEVSFGWFWSIPCRSATLASVVFHSGGTSKTVSVRHVPFLYPLCTPVDYVSLTVVPQV